MDEKNFPNQMWITECHINVSKSTVVMQLLGPLVCFIFETGDNSTTFLNSPIVMSCRDFLLVSGPGPTNHPD
jgi:hypothetical protein